MKTMPNKDVCYKKCDSKNNSPIDTKYQGYG